MKDRKRNNLAGNYKDRVVVFKSLVGSHNYNLDTPSSDKDYKVFVFPTFEDLYSGKSYKDNVVGEVADFQVHDIRRLPDLLIKSNVNFVEALFSIEAESFHELHTRLWNIREDIARMNLPYLYDACMGMFNKEVKMYKKKMEEGDEKKAFKYAASAFRSANFLYRFYNTDFSDFKAAIWYEGYEREYIYGVKTGVFSSGAVERVLEIHEDTAVNLKSIYKSFSLNEDVASVVNYWVERYVREHISEQLLKGGK